MPSTGISELAWARADSRANSRESASAINLPGSSTMASGFSAVARRRLNEWTSDPYEVDNNDGLIDLATGLGGGLAEDLGGPIKS